VRDVGEGYSARWRSRTTSPEVLKGLLSNPSEPLAETLSFLDLIHARPASPRLRRKRPEVEPSSRRRFGSVVDAVGQVLSEANEPMRFVEIQEAVEQLADGPIAWSSVKSVLSRKSMGPDAPFRRIKRGLYESILRSSRR
jgi:hypothetical protein